MRMKLVCCCFLFGLVQDLVRIIVQLALKSPMGEFSSDYLMEEATLHINMLCSCRQTIGRIVHARDQ